jgi:hypothetical protein
MNFRASKKMLKKFKSPLDLLKKREKSKWLKVPLLKGNLAGSNPSAWDEKNL